MQVTMTMEEYQGLKDKLIDEYKKERLELDGMQKQQRLELELFDLKMTNKMLKEDIENNLNVDNKSGCKFCSSEATLMDTADCNIIYISKDNDDDKFYLANSDSYTGNRKQINYCPMCGKKLGGENK